jgi:dTDP-4-amino-4,6-dideoxygalactose transaminase
VLEDCAQAAGLSIQGKKAGAWGDVSAFSFYPTKNLFSLGDGGAIATNNPLVREAARMLSRYGADLEDKYIHKSLGQNSRLDTIQAGFVLHALDFLDEWNYIRKMVAHKYDYNFRDLAITPTLTYESVYHHYCLFLNRRDKVRDELSLSNIGTEIHYPNVAGIEAKGGEITDFPVSFTISQKTLSLPISPWQTSRQTNRVIDTILKLVPRSLESRERDANDFK